MWIRLVVLSAGPWEGKSIPVGRGPFAIGRDAACQLRPASRLVSQRHCDLLAREGKVYVRDRGSTNGTFVNGRRLQGEVELLDRDQLRVGPLLFEVRREGVPAVSCPTPTPPTRGAGPGSAEEDAAALLLSLGDAAGPSGGGGGSVGEGSTELEIPNAAVVPGAGGADQRHPAPAAGDTAVAAKRILDKYLHRPRNT